MLETKNSEQITQQVRPVLQTDENGFIISDVVEKEKISAQYREAIDKIVEIQTENLKEGQIHSIYVFGSVARGLETPGQSDLDITTVVKGNTEDVDRKWIPEAKKLLEKKLPFYKEIRLRLYLS